MEKAIAIATTDVMALRCLAALSTNYRSHSPNRDAMTACAVSSANVRAASLRSAAQAKPSMVRAARSDGAGRPGSVKSLFRIVPALQPEQASVPAFGPEQFGVAAVLGNAAVLKHDDAVGPALSRTCG